MSNLPTVWTNVLAATVLAGGAWQNTRTAIVLVAMSLFYVGGMYLNDYFDRAIDARERPSGRFRRAIFPRTRSRPPVSQCSAPASCCLP